MFVHADLKNDLLLTDVLGLFVIRNQSSASGGTDDKSAEESVFLWVTHYRLQSE